MDTRTKIVSLVEAQRLAASKAVVVSGYFDPLIASHSERLRGLKQDGKSLLVVISDPPDPILPRRARAELVAGLAAVDYVTEEIGELKPDVRLEKEDEERFEQLVEHVHKRQQAGE